MAKAAFGRLGWRSTISVMLVLQFLSVGYCDESPQQTDGAETLNPAQMKEDIDFLVKTIKDCHVNPYAYISKEKFESAVRKTGQACEQGSMSIEEFYRHAAWLAGQVKNGHTRIYAPKRWHEYGGRVFPLFWKLDENEVRLLKSPCLDASYWGATVLTISGKPALEVMRYYSSLLPKEGKDSNLTVGFEVKYLWRSMALDFGDNELALKLKSRDGRVEDITVKAVSIRDAFKGQKISTSPAKRGPVTYRYLDGCDAGYIEIMSFGDAERFREEIEKAFSDLKASSAKNLIIDVRGCPGGNSSLSVELLAYLTGKKYKEWQKCKYKYSKLYQEQRGKHGFLLFTGNVYSYRPKVIEPKSNPLRFSGNLYLLIDGKTGSTAASFAGIVKHYKLGTLIGQETGDTMAMYGDALSFKLPNSQMAGNVACKYYENPGTTEDNAMRGVQPDRYIECDRAMELAEELCSRDQD